MVKQGELVFAQFFENGATHVLSAGVQLVASFGTSTRSFPVKQDQISFGTISFVRVRPGTIGLATDNGQPVLLLPGQHIYNEPNFEFARFEDVTKNVITNGILQLIRVPPGSLG